MAVLKTLVVAAAVALAGCYSPDVRDCVVTCSAGSECAGDQTCGSDGYCAAPDVAGTCAAHATVDAAPPPTVDGSIPATVSLHITITGTGTVRLSLLQVCSSQGSQHGDCTFSIPSQTATTLMAMPSSPKDPFDMWSGGTCAGMMPMCMFTPTGDVTVGAAFK